MKKQKGSVTALELNNRLAHDAEYLESVRKRDQEFEIIWKKRAAAEKPLIADVRKSGFDISSVYDFVNSAKSYAAAIPVLVHYLKNDLISEPVIKEGIIRALTVKEAAGIANDVLLDIYYKIPLDNSFLNENLRWLIGNALNIIITEKDIERIVKIVQDKNNGLSRQMFVRSLSKFKTERVENVLISLLNDQEVAIEAINVLGKLKSKKSLNKIQNLLGDPNPKTAKRAKEAIKNINKQ